MKRTSNGEMGSSSNEIFDFEYKPTTPVSFNEALGKARKGYRLSVDDGVSLMITGPDREGIDPERKKKVLELANRRREEIVGDDVTVVANLNNNLTTACNTGCLFCNFKNPAVHFESNSRNNHSGFVKTPEESYENVKENVKRGIYEVTSVSGLHPALVLDESHRKQLEKNPVNYKPPEQYDKSPGTYCDHMRAMKQCGIHVHSMTPEEAYHAKRGTKRTYGQTYEILAKSGLDSVPGTAAEILVEEVREIICPNKISTEEWTSAMRAVGKVGLPMTTTIMYGHIENERHRVMHLKELRDLQDETGNVTEFVPLKFVYEETPLYDRGYVDGSSDRDEDELMIAVSRLFLDNIENVQSSWVKYGDELGLNMLDYGANDFMGTLLSEEITRRAGGDHGEFRSFETYRSLIESIDRRPVERSTDYDQFKPITTNGLRVAGPQLGPEADGTPLLGVPDQSGQ